MPEKKFDLEDRLVEFVGRIIEVEDFVHKMKIILKELKESRVCLKIILHKQLIKPISRLGNLYQECEELIAIAAKSIATAKKNIDRKLP